MSTNPQGGIVVFRDTGRRRTLSRKRKVGGVLAFVLAALIGVGAYAFTASNTVPEQHAGAGFGKVSGYVVAKNVSYTFDPTGTKMTNVVFMLNSPAHDVKVALTEAETPTAAGEWDDCGASTEASPTEFEVKCEFAGGIEDKKGDHLSVAAVSEGEVKVDGP